MSGIALEAQAVTQRQIAVTVTDQLSDAAGEHLQDAQTYLLEQITHQLERDIEFLQLSLRRAVLQVQLSANSRRIPIRQAQIEYQRSNPGALQFSFQDRGNNKWSSKVYIRTTFRHNLLSLYNEVVLLTLADHGIDTAEVSHTDPKSEFNGVKISAVPGSKIPTYSDIRDKAFHPNSNAIVIYGGA